jgi:predicted P-loop ATPase
MALPWGPGTHVVPFPITNEQFLKAIFGPRWGEVLVSYFQGDPKTARNWQSYPAATVLGVMHAGLNNYYDVSLPGAAGGRTGASFDALYAIVIDDYGVKVDPAKVEQLLGVGPNYVIETSPGNYHAGWFIEPLSDRAWVLGLLRDLYKALGAGDNLVKPTTLVRLPVGTNGKAELPFPFRVKLVHWQPGTRIQHLDWIDIEARLGAAVVPVNARMDLGNLGAAAMPDPAEIEADIILKIFRGRAMVLGLGRSMTFGWGFDVECPWASEHTDPRTAASYVPVRERFKCHHGHCQDRNIADVREWADGVVREDSGGLECLASLAFDEVPGGYIAGTSRIGPGRTGPGAAEADAGADPNWRARWPSTGKHGDGRPTSNAANVLIALEHAPELQGAFGFNAFTLQETLHRELPGVRAGTTPGVPRAWRDVDTVILQAWLQGQGLVIVSTKMVDDAVSKTMHARSYHPVCDWLKGLVWDQTPRLDTWIADYLGAKQDPYTAHVGRWWLMMMCRRVFEPGCRADYMPVLEGPQGYEKSTALACLAGAKAWFSDQLPDIASKDASDHMVGRWLIEVAEMDRFNSTESAAMKAFVTRTTERYRRAYAKRTADEPRQCVFAGTVNHGSYLKDDTGNRRYWPIATGRRFDVAGLALARDQLFAEAWHYAVTLNQPYWPEPLFEDLFMQPEQDQRLEADPWDHLVASYLVTKAQVLVHEVIVAVTGGGSHQLSTANRNRVTRIMEGLKWSRGKRGNNGERFWYPSTALFRP